MTDDEIRTACIRFETALSDALDRLYALGRRQALGEVPLCRFPMEAADAMAEIASMIEEVFDAGVPLDPDNRVFLERMLSLYKTNRKLAATGFHRN